MALFSYFYLKNKWILHRKRTNGPLTNGHNLPTNDKNNNISGDLNATATKSDIDNLMKTVEKKGNETVNELRQMRDQLTNELMNRDNSLNECVRVMK